MASNELQAQASSNHHMIAKELSRKNDLTFEEQAPSEKSSVYTDPFAADQSCRFQKGDVVHMAIVEGGVRTKGTFTVAKGRRHSSGAYYEYQLVASGSSYKNGAWIREKHLKGESRS